MRAPRAQTRAIFGTFRAADEGEPARERQQRSAAGKARCSGLPEPLLRQEDERAVRAVSAISRQLTCRRAARDLHAGRRPALARVGSRLGVAGRVVATLPRRLRLRAAPRRSTALAGPLGARLRAAG